MPAYEFTIADAVTYALANHLTNTVAAADDFPISRTKHYPDGHTVTDIISARAPRADAEQPATDRPVADGSGGGPVRGGGVQQSGGVGRCPECGRPADGRDHPIR